MTKLLSDEELGNLIDIAYKTATVGDSNGDKLTKDEFSGYMLATINTQKRLYAESVIGSNELDLIQRPPTINAVATSPHDIAHVNELNRDIEKQYQEYHKAMHRDQLRAEQRSRLNDTK